MTAGRVVPEAGAAPAAAVPTHQIRPDAAFIQKHIVLRVAEQLPRLPPPAGSGDIRPALLRAPIPRFGHTLPQVHRIRCHDTSGDRGTMPAVLRTRRKRSRGPLPCGGAARTSRTFDPSVAASWLRGAGRDPDFFYQDGSGGA